MYAQAHGIAFGDEFLACFEDRASRKPDGAAARSIANNAAGRIKANPLAAANVSPTLTM